MRSTGVIVAVAVCASCSNHGGSSGTAVVSVSIAKVAGDGQVAAPDAGVAIAPRVRVTDASGLPVAGYAVAFTVAAGGGSVAAGSVQTDVAGEASCGAWVLGPRAGENRLEASGAGAGPVVFSATAVAPPATIVKLAGDGQVAAPGSAVAIAPRVRVVDATDRPVVGSAVVFEPTGGASVAFADVRTDAAGEASCGPWTLGTTEGTYRLTATVAGLAPATFAARTSPKVLFEFGHAARVDRIEVDAGRVLSGDGGGYWRLWEHATCTTLWSGVVSAPRQVDLAGSTLLVSGTDAFETRASSTGATLATVSLPRTSYPPKLASDGSYVWGPTDAGLSVWSVTGTLLLTHPGNYGAAKVFAAPGELRVARGPAGANVIETISVPGGEATVSAPFSGDFDGWFVDGARFLTTLGDVVWIYSRTGAPEGMFTQPSVGVFGQGEFVWTRYTGFTAYAVDGHGEVVASYPLTGAASTAGTNVAFLSGSSLTVIDLSGATASRLDYVLPFSDASSFAVAPSGPEWAVGTPDGLVLAGGDGPPRSCRGIEPPASMAGGGDRLAISTGSRITTYDAVTGNAETTLPLAAAKVQLTNDGTLLAAGSAAGLELYSMPAASKVRAWPASAAFALGASGNTMVTLTGSGWEVFALAGESPIWSYADATGSIPAASPDGTRIVVSTGYSGRPAASSVTKIFDGATLVTAVPGWATGWIDDARLLVTEWSYSRMGAPFLTRTVLYDRTGAAVATPPLPRIDRFQVVAPDLIYSPSSNAIYSVTSGSAVWTSAVPPSWAGAVAGGRVYYIWNNRVVSEPY
jgi:hypothetical protein